MADDQPETEVDTTQEITLKNGHQLHEEIVETEDHKEITVTEEGVDANDFTDEYAEEVMDELQEQLHELQERTPVEEGTHFEVMPEIGVNAKGQIGGRIVAEKVLEHPSSRKNKRKLGLDTLLATNPFMKGLQQ